MKRKIALSLVVTLLIIFSCNKHEKKLFTEYGNYPYYTQEEFQELLLKSKNEPDNPFYHDLLATHYSSVGDYNKAFEEIDIAIQLDPKNANYLYTKAHIYYVLHKNEESINILLEASKYDSKNPIIFDFISFNYKQMEKNEMYKKYLKESCNILSMLNDDSKIYYYKGSSYFLENLREKCK